MDWVAYYRLQFGYEYEFHPKIVIPYTPERGRDWWLDFGERIAPLGKTEVMVGDDFWDLLTGRRGTSQVILAAFEEISKSEFANFYRKNLFRWDKDFDFELVEYHQNARLLEEDKNVSRRKKLKWECKCCSNEFSARFGAVRDAQTGCIYSQLNS
jgi:hypothetical protein